MPCGVYKITAIPDDKLGQVEADAELDSPDKVIKEQADNGTWTVTLVFPPCPDNRDPLLQKSFSGAGFSERGAASSGPDAFIQAHLAAAQSVKAKYQVPIAVVLAQSALETGWGRSVVGNSYFGIKARSGQSSITARTREVRSGSVVTEEAAFRSYDGFESAADDYGRFLTENPRYRSAFSHTGDPEEFARAVASAGYATDPAYGDKLVSIIRGHRLNEFDSV